MKKAIRILSITVFVVLALLIILPFAFQSKLKQMALDQANAQLNAKVGFEKVSLSLLRSFPDFSFRIQGVTIDGVGAFADERLLEIGSLDLTLDLMSVIKGEQIEMERFGLINTRINVIVNEEGLANYDIVKPSTTTDTVQAAEATSTEAAFSLTLKSYEIDNLNLQYTDMQGGTELRIEELRHSGRGDFSQEVVQLKTKTLIDAITAKASGVQYLRNASVSSDFDVEYDQRSQRITFGDNNLYLNNLRLYFEGWIESAEEQMDLDLRFSSPGTDFKEVLSLVPAVFLHDFETVSTNGQFSLNGNVKGKYTAADENYPALDFNLNVNNGGFNYPDLPAGIDNISIDLNLNKTQGGLDNLVIDLKQANATIAENPFSLRLLLRTPMSDPNVDMAAKGRIDLSSLGSIVPVEGVNYSGRIDADFKIAAKQSDVDNERYEKIGAKGLIVADKLHLESDSLPLPIDLASARLEWQPQNARLSDCNLRIGNSDFQLDGFVNNIMGYVFGDGVLEADVKHRSTLIDLNELSGGTTDPEKSSAPNDTAAAMEVVRLPVDIDFKLDSEIGQLVFGKLDIRSMKGEVAISEGAIRLSDVGMRMLGGRIAASGEYNSLPDSPEVDMDFEMEDVGFRESYEAFAMVRQLAPVMEKTTGSYSTKFSYTSVLKADMTPDLQSVDAAGRLRTTKINSEPDVMKKVADALKDPSLKQLNINPIDLEFEIADGRLSVKPFDFQAEGIKGKVSGSTGLDQSIDYLMDMNVPTDRISSSGLLGNTGLRLPATVDVKVFIEGKTTSPKVRTSLGDMADDIAEDLKEQATEIVEEKVEEVKEDANKKAQELIDQAEAQGDALIAEAKKQGDVLRTEAKKQADALRDEAEKKASQLEKEAKGNFLKEAAAKEGARKIRQEAEKNAKKIEREADKQANELVAKAEAEKAALVEKARKEAVID